MLVEAKPSEMLIVCGEDNIDIKPELYSNETEVVLTINNIFLDMSQTNKIQRSFFLQDHIKEVI